MDTLQGIAAYAVRGWRTPSWPLVASSSAAFTSAALISCLPTQDLSGYSSGGRPPAPDVSISEQAPSAELPTDVFGAPAEGAVADPSSDCGTECPASALPIDVDAERTDVADRDAQPMPADAGAEAAPEPPAADAGAVCPGGAQPGPGGRCLVLVGVARSWADARGNCRARGAGWDLAVIRGAEQDGALLSLLGSAADADAAIPDAWVGGTDGATEGTWLWVGDSAPFWIGTGAAGDSIGGAYEDWNGSAEPNGGEASDCLRLRGAGGWADTSCSALRIAICEGPAL